jgi:hypothetical protein
MLCKTFDARDYVLESLPDSSGLVSQQADTPSYGLGSIRFLFDQSRYLALLFRIGQTGHTLGKLLGMSFSHRCLNFQRGNLALTLIRHWHSVSQFIIRCHVGAGYVMRTGCM